MSSPPVNIATTVNGAPSGGGGRTGTAGGATGGPAFLAVLDQMLGLAGGAAPGGAVRGAEKPVAGLSKTGQTGAATESSGFESWLADMQADGLADTALPFANPFAAAETSPSTTATPANGGAEAPTQGGRPGANGALQTPADAAVAGLGALIAQTDAASLSGETAPGDVKSGDVKSGDIKSGTSANGRGTDAAAWQTTPQTADAGDTGAAVRGTTSNSAADKPAAPQPAAPATSLGKTGETAVLANAGSPADSEVETVLATFGRQSGQARPSAQSAISAAPQTGAAGAEAAQLAQLSGGNRPSGGNTVRDGEADRQTQRTSREVAGTESAAIKGNAGAGPLERLLAAGRHQASTAANAPAAGDGAPLQPSGGGLFSSTLIAINEVGDAGTTTQIGGQTLASSATSAAAGATATTARPDVGALAVRIAHEARDGTQRFEIALHPKELGRVDVRLDFGADGRVSTHLLVDSNDALDALMRDSRGLERALQAQGLKLDDGGVQYQLRDQSSFARHHNEQGTQDQSSPSGTETDGSTQSSATEEPGQRRQLALGGLDLTI